MSFLFQPLLLIGLPLIALPLVIHLINLRRHRRVEWAAMEFLLESQKRNKKWIFLRQLLLLLLRTAAVALVVFMLAGPVLQSQWGRFFGAGTTHHLILLDDSYSMADRWEQSNAMDEAKRVVTRLLDQATQKAGSQKLTFLKFSETTQVSAASESQRHEFELDRQSFEKVVESLNELQVSETDLGPHEAIQSALGLPEPTEEETRIVYLISDFRSREWREDIELRQLMSRLGKQAAQMHLIQCVDSTRSNLAITHLAPESGIRAAGVESWFEIGVTNYGDLPAVAVTATVTQDKHKLPAIEFDEIGPGDQQLRRFRVNYPLAGSHELQASLESDAVETDNKRYYACQVPPSFPILIIDGSRDGDDGYYLRTALSPGGTSKAGWSPQVEPPRFLRKHEQLAKFAAICLLDVSRLDDPEVDALEKYVKTGGGLGIFLGPQTQRPFYNERMYRDGTGLLPAPLDVPTQLLSDNQRTTPDVVVADHPIFRIFGGQRNSFLTVVAVNFYYALEPMWQFPTSGNTRVLAHLRNGSPFVIEKQFGDGLVVLQLSKLSPKSTDLGNWTNWSLNPVFPVFANELIGYLTASERNYTLIEVGEEIAMELPESDYQPDVQIHGPPSSRLPETNITPRAENGLYQVSAGPSWTSGVWKFELQPREGGSEQRLIAVNVPRGEGDLHHMNREQLALRLPGIDYQFSHASRITATDNQLAGFRLSDTMLYLLLAVLVVEQWLAYQASYHTSSAIST